MHGYYLRSMFLAGKKSNSTTPTWKGLNGNITFQDLQDQLYNKDFSNVEVDIESRLVYKFGKGFCLETKGSKKEIKITSKESKLRVYFVHNTTNTQLIADKNPLHYIEVGHKPKGVYDHKIYEISYHVLDKTLHDGGLCIDYRKTAENYGDCNYRALKEHIFSSYGCYPPWLENTEGKQCEIDIPSKLIDAAVHNHIWNDLDAVTDRRKIDLMDNCKEPCYQVKVKLEEKNSYQTSIEYQNRNNGLVMK